MRLLISPDSRKKYGKGRERQTELRIFDTIEATKVVLRNTKLYVNREEGFVGTSLKKDEFVTECSDIDDIIVFLRDGNMMVTKVSDKSFIGKDIIHVAVFDKSDKRTIYNMIYRDGKSGPSYIKRFNVSGITRDKMYDLTNETKGSQVLYFTQSQWRGRGHHDFAAPGGQYQETQMRCRLCVYRH
jgi:topoisomerase-4 subunit A